MKIANVNFNEVAKGMHLSEDEKGLVIDMFDLTGLDKDTDFNELSDEMMDRIEEYAPAIKDKIAAILFDNRAYWDLNLDGFYLDLERLCNTFPNLKTVACGGGDFCTSDYPDDLRLMSSFDFCDLARSAYRAGDLEKAEYYYRWGEMNDYYDCLYTFALWLSEAKRYDEAETFYQCITGEKDKFGAANNSYASMLDDLGRHEEAQTFFRFVIHGRAHSDAKEYADFFMYEHLQDADSPYWRNLSIGELDELYLDDYYISGCEQDGTKFDLERILLNMRQSSDPDSVYDATEKLIQIYGTGKYVRLDDQVITVPGFPDLKKLADLVKEEECSEYKLTRILYFELLAAEAEPFAPGLEAALWAAEDYYAGEALLALYAAGAYHTYEYSIVLPELKNGQRAVEAAEAFDLWPYLIGIYWGGQYTCWESDDGSRKAIDLGIAPDFDKLRDLVIAKREDPFFDSLLGDYSSLRSNENNHASLTKGLEVALLADGRLYAEEILLDAYAAGKFYNWESGEYVPVPELKNPARALSFAEEHGFTTELAMLCFAGKYWCLSDAESDVEDVDPEGLGEFHNIKKLTALIQAGKLSCERFLDMCYDCSDDDLRMDEAFAPSFEQALLTFAESDTDNSAAREILLELYATGKCTFYCNCDDEYLIPSLKNPEKAAAFAEKYGLELPAFGHEGDEN